MTGLKLTFLGLVVAGAFNAALGLATDLDPATLGVGELFAKIAGSGAQVVVNFAFLAILGVLAFYIIRVDSRRQEELKAALRDVATALAVNSAVTASLQLHIHMQELADINHGTEHHDEGRRRLWEAVRTDLDEVLRLLNQDARVRAG